jgi:tetratricopeptide (TPR) repeat protein
MAPDYYPAHLQLGRAYLRKGAYREALAELEKAKSLSQDGTEALAAVGEAYALAGQKERARRIAGKLTERSQKEYVSAFDIAAVYTALGETEQAFTWLENGYRERASRLVEIKVDPAFDPLRDHPRFQDLLRRMNFPP